MKRFTYRTAAWALAVISTAGLLAGGSASAGERVSFRDLVFKSFENDKDEEDFGELTKATGFTKPIKKVIALEYKVLLLRDGTETVIDPKTHKFRLGEKIRITVEPLHESYIYIFHIGASGKAGFLVPHDESRPPRVKARQSVVLPTDGYFEFTRPPGDEQLKVVAAEEPIHDLATLAAVLTKAPEDYTAEEKKVRATLNATVEANLRSVEEEEDAKRKDNKAKLVKFRSLTGETEQLADEVRQSGAGRATVEIPGKSSDSEGTIAVYLSTAEGGQAAGCRLLVTIPLVSEEGSAVSP